MLDSGVIVEFAKIRILKIVKIGVTSVYIHEII